MQASSILYQKLPVFDIKATCLNRTHNIEVSMMYRLQTSKAFYRALNYKDVPMIEPTVSEIELIDVFDKNACQRVRWPF